MIDVTITTLRIHDGQSSEQVAARFAVRGQNVELLEGAARWVQIGMPVYSDRYGKQIDFDTDGEEWARNLPRAYRNGSIAATVKEVVEVSPARPKRATRTDRVPVLAFETQHPQRRR